jgi:hypothetical protein
VELELVFDGSQDRNSAKGKMESVGPSIAAYPTRAEEPIDFL